MGPLITMGSQASSRIYFDNFSMLVHSAESWPTNMYPFSPPLQLPIVTKPIQYVESYVKPQIN